MTRLGGGIMASLLAPTSGLKEKGAVRGPDADVASISARAL